jgi:beta-RFAP synthase
MFSFGDASRPQFGGVGMMIDPPAVEVSVAPAAEFTVHGDHPARVRRFADAAAAHWQLTGLPCCQVTVTAPPDHVGLGVGTQLGLAVATGLRRFLDMPEISMEELARSVGRGVRSAVGTHGFAHGGFIVDGGKRAGDSLGNIVRHASVPAEWRIVLVRGAGSGRGLAGDREADAFAKLPRVPADVTDELWQTVNDRMLPALEQSDCEEFGNAVYSFGRLAGKCFAPVQGGPFASPDIATLVESIRDHGVPGVGQSSWGPTVFAITADDAAARSLAEWLRRHLATSLAEVVISQPNNLGAQDSTPS